MLAIILTTVDDLLVLAEGVTAAHGSSLRYRMCVKFVLIFFDRSLVISVSLLFSENMLHSGLHCCISQTVSTS